jgi:hypothetical protein
MTNISVKFKEIKNHKMDFLLFNFCIFYSAWYSQTQSPVFMFNAVFMLVPLLMAYVNQELDKQYELQIILKVLENTAMELIEDSMQKKQNDL